MNTCNKKCDCIGGLKFVSVAPALTGAMKPEKGLYCNAIVRYEETGEIWIYTKEGIPVDITSSDPAELERKIREVAQDLSSETAARTAADLAIEESLAGKQNAITASNKLNADLVDDSASDNKFATAAELSAIGTAVQPEDIDYTLVSGLSLNSNPSTTMMQLNASKVNISSGATSSENIPFAVASSTQAGIMNSATFNAVTDNTNNINALLNGAVAVDSLPASPTQAELTTAWQGATGLTTLINRAQIYDSANSKIWTYYTNSSTWYDSPAGGTVSINTFTNQSEGVILGSTNTGQIFAENDGTGSVNGWDALSTAVSNNTNNKLASANLTTSGGITKTTTGSGSATAIELSIADGGIGVNKLDKTALLDLFYPVGSYYETSDATFDPNIGFGGTWVKDSAGRVTVSQDANTFATIGATGGEEEHKLIASETPKHTHERGTMEITGYASITRCGVGLSSAGAFSGSYQSGLTRPVSEAGNGDMALNFKASNSWTGATSEVGGDGYHNNLQPYVVVARWHRTA